MDHNLSSSVRGIDFSLSRFSGNNPMKGMPDFVLDRLLTASRTLFLALGCLFAGVIASSYTVQSEVLVLERQAIEMQAKIADLKSKSALGDIVGDVALDRLTQRVQLRRLELNEYAKTDEAANRAIDF